MKKPSWCEKHFKIRRAVSELQNSSSHFNRTALYVIQRGQKYHCLVSDAIYGASLVI